MCLAKANHFFFLSDMKDHILCDVRHTEGVTHLQFVDCRDHYKEMNLIVKYRNGLFIIEGAGFDLKASRDNVLDVIKFAVDAYLPVDM